MKRVHFVLDLLKSFELHRIADKMLSIFSGTMVSPAVKVTVATNNHLVFMAHVPHYAHLLGRIFAEVPWVRFMCMRHQVSIVTARCDCA